ncbi:Ger(x)C family spore germination protein [Clostridium sp. OS1-26]|uniref:Ger(x)C family spore germination protein n=1 Tax=Clostridium sp. OS1-26 TaxID=3070681 RepID=UPI0027E0E50A|nr:Ger(x)C family spore germination protein [Clostridium sp. OS1-26]WML35237.1 Ger(x)C family spore germination protein [Clostridium sp. OS1-26]
MKKYFKFLFIIIFIPLLLTGCWDQKIYEEIGFILQVGVESAEDHRLLASYTSPVTDPKKREQVELISSNVGSIREFRENSKRVSAKLLQGGKIQQVVISSSLAQKGIINLLEIFERDPANPAIARVVISEDSPKELFDYAQKLGDKPRPSFYLEQLIRNNSESGFCPDVSVFDFSRTYFAPGIDPITPMVKIENEMGKGLRIDGCALFSGDKMVGKIKPKETSLLLAMKGKMSQTEYIFTTVGPPKNDSSGKTGAAVMLAKPKRKIKINIENNIPTVKMSLSFKGDYDEREWNHIDKKEIQKEYEEIMAKELKSECMKILKYTQEVGSDPLGIGNLVRAKHNSFWQNHKWGEVYKSIVFDVDVTLDIVRHGLIK